MSLVAGSVTLQGRQKPSDSDSRLDAMQAPVSGVRVPCRVNLSVLPIVISGAATIRDGKS